MQEPDCLLGWLASTARRECLAVVRRTLREVADGLLDAKSTSIEPGPDAVVPAHETRGIVRRTVAELPLRRRILIGALFAEIGVRYNDISQTLGLATGSIGPTCKRVLRALRSTLEHDGISAVSAV